MKIELDWSLEFPSADGKDWVETTFEIELDVTPGDPGRTYGNPEKCYEGWDAEAEIVAIKLPMPFSKQPPIDIPRNLWLLLGFTNDVMEQIKEKAGEKLNQQAEDDEMARGDADMDAAREDRLFGD